MDIDFKIEDYKKALRLTCKRIFIDENKECPYIAFSQNIRYMGEKKCIEKDEQFDFDGQDHCTTEEKLQCWERYFLSLAYVDEEEKHDTFLQEIWSDISNKYML
jgi:hypothetical protein